MVAAAHDGFAPASALGGAATGQERMLGARALQGVFGAISLLAWCSPMSRNGPNAAC